MAQCKSSASVIRFATLLAFSVDPSSRANVYSCQGVTDYDVSSARRSPST